MFESKILLIFATFMNQTLLICYIRISGMFESKILLIFGTFTNQTVPIRYIRISDMFKPKNSTRFGHIYKSDCFDMSYQNFSCKTRGIIKKNSNRRKFDNGSIIVGLR